MEIARATALLFYVKHNRNKRWLATIAIVSLMLCIPLFVILGHMALPFSENFKHITETVLSDYVGNSLALMLGVAVGTFVLGTSTAWLTSMCTFPGRKLFEWALLLPMAMPAYIIAYTYTGMLDISSPVQQQLRETFHWRYGDYWFPEVRSLGGAICMLSLVLYPYVYLIVRTSFLRQSYSLLEISRSLGLGPWRTFFRVALPSARPAIIAGLSLALMETLADYGTVHYFGISTFTTGIFRTWFGMGDLVSSAQLASILLTFVALLIIVERGSRIRLRYHHTTNTNRHMPRPILRGTHKYLSVLWCASVVALGFALPAAQLFYWLMQSWQKNIDADFATLMFNSFYLAAIASACCLALALLLNFSYRLLIRNKLAIFCMRAATLGYALPGTVIAVGVLIPFANIDNAISRWAEASFNLSIGLMLSGTIVALIFAYTVRFVSVSAQTLESGYSKIQHNIDSSARTLGMRPSQVFQKIHVPLLRSSLLTAFLLVFVDVLKELPTTLILRPFNFNTLAVRAYELASDERLSDAAAASFAIVLVGLIPVILLSKTITAGKH